MLLSNLLFEQDNQCVRAMGAARAGARGPVSISEIQPASPRPVGGAAAGDHRMTPDDGDAEKEDGIEVLLDWVKGGATSVVEWCREHQRVAVAITAAAAVTVGVATAFSKRR